MPDKMKTIIMKYIHDYTNDFCASKKLSGSTQAIAEENFVSRSLVSQYLNDMFKSGALIKINSRPVYFLDKSIIEKTFKITIKNTNFDCVDDLLELLDSKLLDKGVFIDAIGNDGSLNYCIHQMVSAVSYPPNGLPVLLLGDEGTGKTYLAELLSRHCVNEGIAQEKNINHYMLSRHESSTAAIKKIFGYRDSTKKNVAGLLEKSNDGVLIIENLQRADEQFVNRLIQYFKTRHSSSSARVILTAKDNDPIIETLKNEIPICCMIPSLIERPFVERESLVINQLLREQKQIQKQIYISNRVFYGLIHHHYKNNIKELQSVVTSTCANAFKSYEDNIYIKSYNLPSVFFQDGNEQMISAYDDSYIKADEYAVEYPTDSTIVYFELLLGLYNSFYNGEISEEQFQEECFSRMEDYYNYVVFDKQFSNSHLKAFENSLSRIMDYIFDKYQLFLPASCTYVLTKVIYNLAYNNGYILTWQNRYINELLNLKNYFKEKYDTSYKLAKEISRLIKQEMDVELDIANLLFVLLNIRSYNSDLESMKYHCLIVMHGYSTASSMADAVNKIIGYHIFDGIDMPLDTSFQDVMIHIKNYIKTFSIKKDVILLVDMGSLEQLDNISIDLNNMNLGIINNVSTKLALDAASRVKQGKEIEQIVKDCAKANTSTYRLHMAPKKQNAIIFTTEVGEKATERVVQLFKDSLPKNIALSIIAYSYNKLLQNGNNDELFKTNNIVLIVGMSRIEGIKAPFISLEDIIAFSDFELIANALSPYMNHAEIEIFNRNMLKNFSLTSILNNVTILNATKLYEKIAKAIEGLEKSFAIIIPNKIKVGLYIHISCLVERLVLHDMDEAWGSSDENEKEIRRFIKVFRDCFAEVKDYYKIQFPIKEIVYLHSIIQPYIEEDKA